MKHNKLWQSNINISYFVMLFLAVFATFGELLNLAVNKYVKAGVLAVLIVSMFLSCKTLKIARGLRYYLLVMLLMIGLTLYNNEYWNVNNYLLYFGSILTCLFAFTDNPNFRVYIKICKFMYIIYAICTIVFYFTPNFYLNYIVDLFPDNKSRLIAWYNSGCMAGLTEHYSTNAIFLSCGLIIAIADFYNSRICKGRIQVKNVLVVILFLISLLLTGKRGQLVFAISSIFSIYYLGLREEKRSSRLIKAFGLILIFLCLAIVFLPMVSALGTFITRFIDQADAGNITSGRANILWPIAIESINEHPIFGIGWMQYTYTLSRQVGGGSSLYHTHNVYLQLWCEIGLVGLLIYLIWFIANLVSTIKIYRTFVLRDFSKNDTCRFLMTFSTLMQIFFLLYAITGNPLYDESMFIPYFTSCAISMYYRNQTRTGNLESLDKFERI